MKFLIISFFVAVVIQAGACKFFNRSLNDKSTLNDSAKANFLNSNSTQNIKPLYLEGVWAETKDTNENALFQLTGDSILYLESPEKSFFFNLKNDSMIIFLDSFTVLNKILHLDKDSISIREDNGEIVTFYRR